MIDFNREIIPWIGKTAKMLDQHQNQTLKDNGFDITKEQWIILKILTHENGISQNKLACLTNRDKTTMTRLVNTMEKKNLIARLPDAVDKRINLLYITKQGEKIMETSTPIFENVLQQLRVGLSEQEIDVAIDVLKKIQKNINNSDSCTRN